MANEAKICSSEAQLSVAIICGTLYVGFWLQFVIGMLYNIPAIYVLSGGNWYPLPIEFYVKEQNTYPFSMAGNFLFYSIFGSVLALFFGWISTRGVARKIRLRFAVCLFVTLTLGWSVLAFQGEEAAWTMGLDQRIERARQMWRWTSENDEWQMKFYRREVERLEAMKESWQKKK